MSGVRILTQDERRQGYGATDAAAIAGLSQYRAPIDVYLEKRGEAPPQEQTWVMRLGQIFEDAIADAYAEQTGRRLARMSVVFHKEHDFLYAHCDRKVIGEPGLVEVKKTRWAFGESPPPAYRAQAQWQMGLSGRLWDDIVSFAGHDIDIHREERDQALIDSLIEMVLDFHRDHVLTGIEPPPDGTEAYRDYLATRFSAVTDEERTATSEQVLLLDEYVKSDVVAKAMKAEMDRIKNVLGRQMEDISVLLAPQGKVRRLMTSPRTDWKAVARAYRAALVNTQDARTTEGWWTDESLDALESLHTNDDTKPYIRVYPKKEGS